MRPAQLTRLLAILSLAMLLVGFPVIPQDVQARGGGGGVHAGGGYHSGAGYGGGFGGGSFRPEPGHGEYHPQGDHRYNPNNTNVNVNKNVNVNPQNYGHGWEPYYGGGWGAAAGGVAAGLAIGAVVASLPAAARALSVGGQTYYYDGGNYYQSCYQGSESSYCVVRDPNQ
jgi:hypothetical protein